MIGASFALVILGYTACYVALQNMKNGGQGPKFFEALGLSSITTTSADTSSGTPNMTGQPASQNTSPATIAT